MVLKHKQKLLERLPAALEKVRAARAAGPVSRSELVAILKSKTKRSRRGKSSVRGEQKRARVGAPDAEVGGAAKGPSTDRKMVSQTALVVRPKPVRDRRSEEFRRANPLRVRVRATDAELAVVALRWKPGLSMDRKALRKAVLAQRQNVGLHRAPGPRADPRVAGAADAKDAAVAAAIMRFNDVQCHEPGLVRELTKLLEARGIRASVAVDLVRKLGFLLAESEKHNDFLEIHKARKLSRRVAGYVKLRLELAAKSEDPSAPWHPAKRAAFESSILLEMDVVKASLTDDPDAATAAETARRDLDALAAARLVEWEQLTAVAKEEAADKKKAEKAAAKKGD